MLGFLSSATSVGPPGALWHPGDAVWGTFQNTVFDPRREVRLWEDGDELLGFGSYCICWYDPGSRTGLFEPLGTRPAYRGEGLGKAVMLEGLLRLLDLGAHTALVAAVHDNEAARSLYESVGFETANTERLYGRKS